METIENNEETITEESKDIEVVDFSESRFEIRENLELIYYNDVFHLMSENDYVVFKDVAQFIAVNDTYTIKQEGSVITIDNEEFDMVVKAVDYVRGATNE